MQAADPTDTGAEEVLESIPAVSPQSAFDRRLGWIILTVLLVGCVVVLRPFVSALLWAAVLSYSCWPLYERVLGWVRGRRTLAALLMAVGMVLVVLVPLVIVGSTLATNVQGFITASQAWFAQGPPPPPAWLQKVPIVGNRAVERWRAMQGDTAQFWKEAQKVLEPIGAWALLAAVGVGRGLVQLGLSVLIALFLFRDGPAAARRLTEIANRVGGRKGVRLLHAAGGTVRGVVYGILGTSLVQALLAGVGFFIAGVPAVGFLALLTFFASFVPIVGTALIWIPAAIWVFSHSTTGWGVFMLIWGVMVGNLDNVIRPLLISKGSDMPFIVILFGVLGGALTFGFIGVFLGPTLLALGYRLLHEWGAASRVFDEELEASRLISI